jgi:hypothetical protein
MYKFSSHQRVNSLLLGKGFKHPFVLVLPAVVMWKDPSTHGDVHPGWKELDSG